MEDNPLDIYSLINELIITLCDCDDCEKTKCNDTVFIKYHLYMSLTEIDYTDTITTLNTHFKTRLEYLSKKLVYDEKYKGLFDTYTKKSIDLLLSLQYLILYFEEYNSAEDKDEVDTKFNIDVMSTCIEKTIAVDIDTLKTLFTNV